MGLAICRMPKPLAPAGLVERTRALLVERHAREAEARSNFRGLALLLLFVWAMTLLAWPLERQLAAGAVELARARFDTRGRLGVRLYDFRFHRGDGRSRRAGSEPASGGEEGGMSKFVQGLRIIRWPAWLVAFVLYGALAGFLFGFAIPHDPKLRLLAEWQKLLFAFGVPIYVRSR